MAVPDLGQTKDKVSSGNLVASEIKEALASFNLTG